jgi:hypothetical protein
VGKCNSIYGSSGVNRVTGEQRIEPRIQHEVGACRARPVRAAQQ